MQCHFSLSAAMKFEGTESAELVRSCPTPCAAKQCGREGVLRHDWEKVKEHVLISTLIAKFGQHENCLKLLLRTGNAMHVEHTKDPYWGDGIDGSGKNRFGHCLMIVRAMYRKAIAAGSSDALEAIVRGLLEHRPTRNKDQRPNQAAEKQQRRQARIAKRQQQQLP
eukprot:TRINITY_DN922_c0_g1_i4.p1 TRINITY_DN922_c0_g1~~TRINITY_DN922_c0_g1_i4.p1  ORF type:complete len:166 (-),score=25.21 TRINITY_DN922_c0_g1_i4:819-1316(-)